MRSQFHGSSSLYLNLSAGNASANDGSSCGGHRSPRRRVPAPRISAKPAMLGIRELGIRQCLLLMPSCPLPHQRVVPNVSNSLTWTVISILWMRQTACVRWIVGFLFNLDSGAFGGKWKLIARYKPLAYWFLGDMKTSCTLNSEVYFCSVWIPACMFQCYCLTFCCRGGPWVV
jgi:hypothetical protein